MAELVPCKHCGKVPVMDKSHSRRMIHHICNEQRIPWNSWQEVVRIWNEDNSQKSEVAQNSASANKPSIQLPELGKLIAQLETKHSSQYVGSVKQIVTEVYGIIVRQQNT